MTPAMHFAALWHGFFLAVARTWMMER